MRRGSGWTAEEDRLLASLKAQGMMYVDIAPLVGRSAMSCCSRYGWMQKLSMRPERKERVCLGCGDTFMSQHAGNRKCKVCKQADQLLSGGFASYRVAL